MTMDTTHCAAFSPEEAANVNEKLSLVANQTQQIIESVKKTLLLSDAMGLFGAGLVNRLNAGTAEGWERRAPALDEASGYLADARAGLAVLKEELAALQEYTVYNGGGNEA